MGSKQHASRSFAVTELKPKSSMVNGRLWGARARDWADIQEGTVNAVYEAVLARTGVGAGTKYLDVGCGSGGAAKLAHERGAQVSGIDAAETLLVIARERTPQGDFHLGDLEDLPFGNARFDVVTGFNSFQYAANPVVSLAEARRVTKADGVIVIMTWGVPDGMEAAALVGALRPLLPAPPPGAPGPFALSDEAVLKSFAASAGLTPGGVFDVDSPWLFPDEATAVRGLNSSGVSTRAMENSSEAAVSEAHRKALAPFRQQNGSYRIGASYRCLLARP
jgi:SAM-dependent methyltransferase